jgi:hypothetical protein
LIEVLKITAEAQYSSTEKSLQNLLLPGQFAGIITEVSEIMNILAIPWLRY